MAINLNKGEGINLTKAAPSLTKVRAGLGWTTPPNTPTFDLDVSAFVLKDNNGAPRLISENHLVFYNNFSTPNKSVRHSGDNRTGAGDGDDETIFIDLSLLEDECNEISFIVTIDKAAEKKQNFGQVQEASIRIYNDATGEVLVEYKLNENFTTETSVQIGSLFKENGNWTFNAIGAGYALGLQAYVSKYFA